MRTAQSATTGGCVCECVWIRGLFTNTPKSLAAHVSTCLEIEGTLPMCKSEQTPRLMHKPKYAQVTGGTSPQFWYATVDWQEQVERIGGTT